MSLDLQTAFINKIRHNLALPFPLYFEDNHVGGMNLHGQKEELFLQTYRYQIYEDICIANYYDIH